jgi:nucleobase:cation symporter-1, NCS1 family
MMYAGEHTAGTEFMIGPLFLAAGVSAFDLLVGLLVGNILAVLSWRFICATVATDVRLTLYRHLEQIGGRNLMILYNVANGILFCFLAGSMVTVSATAVGIPFDLEMPKLSDTMPTNTLWVLIVIVIGLVMTVVAAKGYNAVSRFAEIASPWMSLVFLACGIVALRELNISSWSDFWQVWGQGSKPFHGQVKFTFWHVVFFAWFCNAAMHIGMADLTVFRFARKPSAGWAASAGMFVGHYLAWICASLLYVVFLQRQDMQALLQKGEIVPVSPGHMAYDAIGVTGLLVVIIAGWTTANPTIYRAGLAFQAMIPRSSTISMTLLAGAIATVAGIFPAFAMKLLGFVATYGFILAPIGAIIFFDHYLSKRFNIIPLYASHQGLSFNTPVFIAWLLSIGVFYSLSLRYELFLSFLTLPAWILCGILFLFFSKRMQKNI